MSESEHSIISACVTEAKKRSRSFKKIRWLRYAVQALVLLLFLYLFLRTGQSNIPVFHDVFFDLDPLAGISAMLASRQWIPGMAWGLLTLVLAAIFGRAWCSWICPMGTVIDWTPARKPDKKNLDIAAFWRWGKYFLLLVILAAALLGSLTLMFLDPITILFRTLASVILPGLNAIVLWLEQALYQVAPLTPLVDWMDRALRGGLILSEQPFFIPGLLVSVLFIAALALNAIRKRFWCRYLCPLGGLLALVSKIAIFRHSVNEKICISCSRCASACHTGAIDPSAGYRASAAECTTCLRCVEVCPTGAVSFRGQAGNAPATAFDPSRRQFLSTLGIAAVGAALLKIIPLITRKNEPPVRPPGADEDSITALCIRCGECIRACPTGVIQANPSPASWETGSTPVLNTRFSYCDYGCNACGNACPTGAIVKLTLSRKQKTVIGKARIDQKRCIPWAEGRDCIVCEEMCPVTPRAVLLDAKTVTGSNGQKTKVNLPRVQSGRCIGCGICEAKCPVSGEAAIQVSSIEEI